MNYLKTKRLNGNSDSFADNTKCITSTNPPDNAKYITSINSPDNTKYISALTLRQYKKYNNKSMSISAYFFDIYSRVAYI